MSCKRACIIGGHHFHVKMSYGRISLIGGHILQADMSSGGQVLQEDILWEVMYYGETCLMKSYVLQEDIL